MAADIGKMYERLTMWVSLCMYILSLSQALPFSPPLLPAPKGLVVVVVDQSYRACAKSHCKSLHAWYLEPHNQEFMVIFMLTQRKKHFFSLIEIVLRKAEVILSIGYCYHFFNYDFSLTSMPRIVGTWKCPSLNHLQPNYAIWIESHLTLDCVCHRFL